MKYPQSKERSLVAKHAIVYNESIAVAACARLRKIIDDRVKAGYSKDGNLFKFGEISDKLRQVYKKITGEEIYGKDMYTGQKVLFHHRTGEKAEKDKLATLEDMVQLPKNIRNMDVYIHKKEIVFSDNKNKYVLRPNVTIKNKNGEEKVINHVGSSKLKDENVFKRSNGYIKITP